jgi:hypothetical protein
MVFSRADRPWTTEPSMRQAPPRTPASTSAPGLLGLQALVGNAAVRQLLGDARTVSIQRDYQYELLTGEAEQQQRLSVDTELGDVNTVLRAVPDPAAARDLRQALEQYSGPPARRVPVEQGRLVSPAQTGGEYFPHRGRRGTILLLSGGGVPLGQALVHEAMHALHFNRHPELRRIVPEVHGFNEVWERATHGTARQRHAAHETLIALAFTEYWAARRAAEYRWASNPRNGTLRNAHVEGMTWQVERCQILLRQAHIEFNPAASSRWPQARASVPIQAGSRP